MYASVIREGRFYQKITAIYTETETHSKRGTQ